MISKYEDEIKYLINSSEQLNEVYKKIKRDLSVVTECEITQNDGYLDDSDLTLYNSGVSLRIRHTDATPMKMHSIEMKLKDQIADSGSDGVYKRREVKKEISQQQQDDLDKGVSLNKVNPEFHELVCDLLSLPAIELQKKFDLITTRKKLVVQDAHDNQMTMHFDLMQYSFDDTVYKYFELEIKVQTPSNFLYDIINNLKNEYGLLSWDKSKYDRGIYLFKRACNQNMTIQGDDLEARYHLSDQHEVQIFNKYRNILDSVYRDYIFHKQYYIREEQRILKELQILLKDTDHENLIHSPKTYVHSFRSRIKNADHVISKIIRKADKYFNNVLDIEKIKHESLTTENYKSILTDFIGVRVLHLFKDNWLEIDKKITEMYGNKIVEKKFYVRKGDEIQGQNDLQSMVEEHDFEFEERELGYRSAHYIIKREIHVDSGDMFTTYAELQVRTVFEEAFSEVDHEIRYPHYEKDVTINNFLKTFNRIAGSADEMATYIKLYRDSLKK